ncbi:MAG: fasciclin domain-containing protein [Rhizobacter sp.]|nr:fasciclin domain-containing protein [Chlorobiales bacterium]
MAMEADSIAKAPKDIIETAVAAGQFNTLAALLTEAGLVDALKGDGPFTVFAPTDSAFAKIPAADLEKLKADKEKLAMVLKYHVVSGKVMAADVKTGPVKTLAEKELKATVADGKVMVDKANVVTADIVAKNGVIHVIDSVIMPK